MPIQLIAAGATDPGRKRQTNEDAYFVKITQSSAEEDVGLFVVADGMGGHQAGDTASRLVVETIWDALSPLFAPRSPRATVKLSEEEMEREIQRGRATVLLDETIHDREMADRVTAAVQRANQVVRTFARRHPGEAGDTGSTVTLALVRGDVATIANVGDSRTYLVRAGAIHRITTDHSLVASLVASKQITEEEVYTHPQRNLVYRNLGDKDKVEVDIFQRPLQPGDVLLLCSDGLWEMVRDPQILEIIQSAPSPETACRQLIAQANQNGGEDNIAVVVAQVREAGSRAVEWVR